jgi:hypothetical protein
MAHRVQAAHRNSPGDLENAIVQNAPPTYCVIRNNRRPSLKRDERLIIVNRAGEWRLAFSPRLPSGDVR